MLTATSHTGKVVHLRAEGNDRFACRELGLTFEREETLYDPPAKYRVPPEAYDLFYLRHARALRVAERRAHVTLETGERQSVHYFDVLEDGRTRASYPTATRLLAVLYARLFPSNLPLHLHNEEAPVRAVRWWPDAFRRGYVICHLHDDRAFTLTAQGAPIDWHRSLHADPHTFKKPSL